MGDFPAFSPEPSMCWGLNLSESEAIEAYCKVCKLKIVNPVVRQIVENIGKLGRELENSQPNPPQTNGGTTSEQFLSKSKVKCREFSDEAQHNPLPAFVLVASLALLAMSSQLVLPQLLSKDQVTAQILR